MTATEKGFEEDAISLLASKSSSLCKIRVYVNIALWKVRAFLSAYYIVRTALHSQKDRVKGFRKFSVEYSAMIGASFLTSALRTSTGIILGTALFIVVQVGI